MECVAKALNCIRSDGEELHGVGWLHDSKDRTASASPMELPDSPRDGPERLASSPDAPSALAS